MSKSAVAARDEYLGEFHVYEPHRAGLPKLGPYFRELWRRRLFAVEMSRSSMRASDSDTVFGQLWNVLNPLLLAGVYYLLVEIISPGKRRYDYFPHLLGGLFAFYLVAGCMNGGASSVISAGRIIMNTAFPRALLPISAVRTSVRKFLPTMIVYFAVFVFVMVATRNSPLQNNARKGAVTGPHLHFSWHMFLAIPMLLLIIVFGTGMAMFLATLQVYFRDTSSFLPYITRIWLYVSPVLYYPEALTHRVRTLQIFNPLYGLLGGWGDILVRGETGNAHIWLSAVFWSLLALVVGSLFFMSRERDFAVRL